MQKISIKKIITLLQLAHNMPTFNISSTEKKFKKLP
jgi:hypothetical protein